MGGSEDKISFFELLQVAIGNRDRLSRTLSPDEWEEMYDECKRQTMVGIGFAGVERLPQEQMPPGRRIRQWAVKADKIREQNAKVSKECVQVSRFFEKGGFDVVILKGQGNYAYYPENLQGLRGAGDIDVWVVEHPIRKVIEFCLGKRKGEYVYYHNMDFPILKDTPVEVHYRPTWLYNPFRNRVLQKWFKQEPTPTLPEGKRQEGKSSKVSKVQRFQVYNGYKIPSVEFNVVFQLLHLYKHIFEEGIGLRQLLDYYFVVMKYGNVNGNDNLNPNLNVKGFCVSQRTIEPLNFGTLELIKKLGLENFAGAVMYVMERVFAMPRERMPWKPDEKRGERLLEEIMIGGNFGKFDERYSWAETTNGSMEYRGASYAFARLRHNARFMWNYPSEVLWEPVFRVYHWVWRRLKLWRFE